MNKARIIFSALTGLLLLPAGIYSQTGNIKPIPYPVPVPEKTGDSLSPGYSPSYPVLLSGEDVSCSSGPSYFTFNNQSNFWCAVGVRADLPEEDWDIYLYEDGTFTPPLLAASTYGASTPVDFVVIDNNHAPMQERGIMVNQYSGTNPSQLEYEGGVDIMQLGENDLDYEPYETSVVRMFDVYLTPGTYVFNLWTNSGGHRDLGMALFGSVSNSWYVGRSGCMAMADNAHPGSGAEQFEVTISSSDWYGLCVFNNSTLTDYQSFVLRIDPSSKWTGAVSGDWNDPANWAFNHVPDEETDVTISGLTSVNDPVIATGSLAKCRDLILTDDASLQQNSGSVLHICGNLRTDQGALTMQEPSQLHFRPIRYNISWSDADSNDTYDAVFFSDTSEYYDFYGMTLLSNFTVNGPLLLNRVAIGLNWHVINVLDNSDTALQCYVVLFWDWYQRLNVAGGLKYTGGPPDIVTFAVGGNCTQREPYSTRYYEIILNGSGDQYLSSEIVNGEFCANGLTIGKPGGTVYLQDDLRMDGDMRIFSGTLSVHEGPSSQVSHKIILDGYWYNLAGPEAFIEGEGSVSFGNVYGSPSTPHESNISTEDFYILETHNNLSISYDTVACEFFHNHYHLRMSVFDGKFNAYDLVDEDGLGLGGYTSVPVRGQYYSAGNSIIELSDNSPYANITACELHTYLGSVVIHHTTASDPVNVNLGCFWMRGGKIDIPDRGVALDYTPNVPFPWPLDSGIIRTRGNIYVNGADFYMGGTTLEMYGNGTDSLLTVPGVVLNNLIINKTVDSVNQSQVLANSGPDLRGDFKLVSGSFKPKGTMHVGGDWINTAGNGRFSYDSTKVVFNGSVPQHCFGESFDTLEVDKPTGRLVIPDTAVVECASYRWSAGGIEVDGGTFTVLDLAADGLSGDYVLTEAGGLIELHQDSLHGIDLNGHLDISSGTLNVYGGFGSSYWPFTGDAGIAMSGGTLDFRDRGVHLNNSSFSFDENISGGLIRVKGNFTGDRPDFHPAGGTIEMYGSGETFLSHGTGSSFQNVKICKPDTASVSVLSPEILVNGNFIVDEGIFGADGNVLTINGNVNINEGGQLSLNAGSELVMTDNDSLNINEGGLLKCRGDENFRAVVRAVNNSSHYQFNIFPGGRLAADLATFRNMSAGGLRLHPGSLVDSIFSLNHCVFEKGSAGGTLLTIDNDQVFSVDGAVFPQNTWAGAHNVAKTQNQGCVYFNNALGGFSGELYESDPYDHIHWHMPLYGTISYDNLSGTLLAGVKVVLYQSGSPVDSTLSDAEGRYAFMPLPGTYTIRCTSATEWGGVNSTDAFLVLKHFVELSLLTGLKLAAANVDNQQIINSNDALLIAKRFAGFSISFYTGDWYFEENTVTLTTGSTISSNIRGICTGDVNGSYIPPY